MKTIHMQIKAFVDGNAIAFCILINREKMVGKPLNSFMLIHFINTKTKTKAVKLDTKMNTNL